MVSTISLTLSAFLFMHEPVHGGLKRPDKDKKAWEWKVLKASDHVSYKPYANGRGWIKSNGKADCYGKWENAERFGARKKKIKQYCIRLHEKYQDDTGYIDIYNRYNCRLDPNDKGASNGRKKRDWLCYEHRPYYVLMPPHGPGFNATCKSEDPWDHRVLSWYPSDSPPKWCEYNWYAKRQVCWCVPGFYRESPYDKSLKKRGCPKKEIFIVPNFVRRTALRQLGVSNDTPDPPNISGNMAAGHSEEEKCSCHSPSNALDKFSDLRPI